MMNNEEYKALTYQQMGKYGLWGKDNSRFIPWKSDSKEIAISNFNMKYIELNSVDFITICFLKGVIESCSNLFWFGKYIHFSLFIRMLYIQKGMSIKGGSHD